MAITQVPPMTDVPPFPALADRDAGNYNSMAYAFGTHMANQFNGEIAAVAANVFNNATEAETMAAASVAAANAAAEDRAHIAVDRIQTGQDVIVAGQEAARAAAEADRAEAAAGQIGTLAAFSDANPVVKGSVDPTKLLRFEVDGFTAGATHVATMPDKSGTMAMIDDVEAGVLAASVGDHCVTVHTGNGYGSINNKIRRFSTLLKNVGTAISYVDSPQYGSSFTINEAGIYGIFFTESPTGSDQFIGVSLNSSSLTTNIAQLTGPEEVISGVVARSASSVQNTHFSFIDRFKAGDVIRPHTDGVAGSQNKNTRFYIRKVSK